MLRERLSSAYFYSLAGVGVVAITGVMTGVLSSRKLGPIGRGELTALLLLPGLFGLAGNLGLAQAVGYLDNPARSRSHPVAAAALVAGLGVGAGVCLCLLPLLGLLLPNLPRDLLGSAALCLLCIPLTYVYSAMRGADLAAGRFRSYSALQVGVGFSQVVFMVLFWRLGRPSATTFGLSIVLAVLAVLVVRAPALKRMLSAGGISRATVAEVLSRAWAFTQPELAGMALLRCDVLILARLVPNQDLGLYAVALAVAFGQAFTASPLSQVCFHSTSAAPDRTTGIELLARQFRLLQIPFLAITALAIAVAPVIVRAGFGARFIEAVPEARILILAMAVWSCSQILEGGMRGLDLARLCSLSNLIGLAMLFVSGPVLLRSLGLAGMAIGVLLSHSVSLAAKFWMLQSKTHCSVGRFWVWNRSGIADVVAVARTQIRLLSRSPRSESLETVGSV